MNEIEKALLELGDRIKETHTKTPPRGHRIRIWRGEEFREMRINTNNLRLYLEKHPNGRHAGKFLELAKWALEPEE